MAFLVNSFFTLWNNNLLMPQKKGYKRNIFLKDGEKMILCERMKQLRKEKGWKQGDLADKIGSDARQISRYENRRVTPSLDAIVKIALAFDVTIDYLLIEDCPRAPLKTSDPELMDRLQNIHSLSEEDKNSLFHILDALLTKNKVKALAQNMG